MSLFTFRQINVKQSTRLLIPNCKLFTLIYCVSLSHCCSNFHLTTKYCIVCGYSNRSYYRLIKFVCGTLPTDSPTPTSVYQVKASFVNVDDNRCSRERIFVCVSASGFFVLDEKTMRYELSMTQIGECIEKEK